MNRGTLNDFASRGRFGGIGVFPSRGIFSQLERIRIECFDFLLHPARAATLTFPSQPVALTFNQPEIALAFSAPFISLTYPLPLIALTYPLFPLSVTFPSRSIELEFHAVESCQAS